MSIPLGETRTHVARDHAFIGPDSHVAAALPGWRETPGIVLISPAMGAGFCQYIATMGGKSASGMPAAGVQRFIFVREGEVKLSVENKTHALGVEGYAYVPPNTLHEVTCGKSAVLYIFEYRYSPTASAPGSKAPGVVVGHVSERKAEPFLGDADAMLANLLPGDESFDLAVNLFTFKSGAALPFVEVHVFEHGMFMTKGQGVYRLGDRWYPIQAGDAIWMGPYCPQWFCAIGKGPAQYLYSKNINRDAMS